MPSLPSGPGLRRLIVVAAAITVAAAPALTGLRGNESFAQSVPVSIPSDARVMTAADFEPPESDAEPLPTPSPSHTRRAETHESASTRPRSAEPSHTADGRRGRSGRSPEPSSSPTRKASPRPVKPSRSPHATLSPSPSATADDHGGNQPATIAPTEQPATEAPTTEAASPAASATADDHGGHGGGSGKGGGDHQ